MGRRGCHQVPVHRCSWLIVTRIRGNRKTAASITNTARETPSVHQLRNAREMVIIIGYEE
jgi:hypothetical protein